MPTVLAFPQAFQNSNWPALIVGLLVAAYWARVVRMVRRTRKAAGHGANFVPPEPLGRALRVLWMPVVGLWVLLPLLAFFVPMVPRGVEFALGRVFYVPLLAWGAALVAIAAFAATLVCWKKMGKSWRMGIDPDDKTQLVCSGPYAYVRHPIYALSSLLMLMTMVVVPSPLMLAVGFIHLALLQWEAGREERYLIQLHGEDYRTYRSHTGRFLPRSLSGYTPQ